MSGNNTDNPPTDVEPSPEDAFALVGNEIRAEIIRVLGEIALGRDSDLTFTEIRSRMDSELEPSQLHYHLKQLVGHFVEKTNSGYRLRVVGYRLYETLRAGSFNRHREQLSINTDSDCYHCQGQLKVTFEDGAVSISCNGGGHGYMGSFVDISLERFEEESAAFSHFCQYNALKYSFLARGICPSCTNSVSPEFRSHGEEPRPSNVKILWSCDLCGTTRNLLVGTALLADPELIAFCYNHGVDVLSTPWWEFEFAATDKHVTVRSTDPWEVALEVTLDGDTLELIIDGDLNVVERNRRDAPAEGSPSLLRRIQSGVRLIDSIDRGDEVVLPGKTACLEYLRRHRWPDGMTCFYCDDTDTVKMGTTSKGAQRYQCHNCDSTFNDLTGTVFAERHLSLPEMFYIISEMDDTETTKIAQNLDRSYKSVLDFVHSLQDARDANPEQHL